LKSSIIALAVLASLAAFVSCEDPVAPPVNTTPRLVLNSPTEVIEAFVKSYNDRDHAEYKQILDAEFEFFFAPSDVAGNPPIPQSWDRDTDVTCTGNMFNPNWVDPDPTYPVPPISKMQLTLYLQAAVWEDWKDPGHPDETWKRATMRYDYRIYAGENLYVVGTDPRAQFTCRPIKFAGKQQWRLVEWHDLGYQTTAAQLASNLVLKKTWGAIKYLYR